METGNDTVTETTTQSWGSRLGDLVEVGTGLVAGLIAFICSLATIGVAWLFYRPILGGILLALAAGGVFLLLKKRAAARAAASVKAA